MVEINNGDDVVPDGNGKVNIQTPEELRRNQVIESIVSLFADHEQNKDVPREQLEQWAINLYDQLSRISGLPRSH